MGNYQCVRGTAQCGTQTATSCPIPDSVACSNTCKPTACGNGAALNYDWYAAQRERIFAPLSMRARRAQRPVRLADVHVHGQPDVDLQQRVRNMCARGESPAI